jgi:hypothetical protein
MCQDLWEVEILTDLAQKERRKQSDHRPHDPGQKTDFVRLPRLLPPPAWEEHNLAEEQAQQGGERRNQAEGHPRVGTEQEGRHHNQEQLGEAAQIPYYQREAAHN